jgi:hypothetical protein
MKNRKFKAFFIIAMMLFTFGILTIFKTPEAWLGISGALIAGLVALVTAFFGGNVAHAAQKSKYFRPELKEGEKDEKL